MHPSEVEAAIAEHEGVREVAVVGFANLPEGEEIAAFVVPSGNLTEASLVAHCRARLSSDKRPRKFAFVTKLPRNAKWQDFSGDASPGTRQRRLTPLVVAGSGELSRYRSIASRFQVPIPIGDRFGVVRVARLMRKMVHQRTERDE